MEDTPSFKKSWKCCFNWKNMKEFFQLAKVDRAKGNWVSYVTGMA